MVDSASPPPPPPAVMTFPAQTEIKTVVLQNLKKTRADISNIRPETEVRQAWKALCRRYDPRLRPKPRGVGCFGP